MHGDMWLFYRLIGLCIVACGLAGVCHWSTCLVVGFAVALGAAGRRYIVEQSRRIDNNRYRSAPFPTALPPFPTATPPFPTAIKTARNKFPLRFGAWAPSPPCRRLHRFVPSMPCAISDSKRPFYRRFSTSFGHCWSIGAFATIRSRTDCKRLYCRYCPWHA